MKIPENHPRKKSLELRRRIEKGFEKGIVAKAGLIAHGRGEALDYLLGEKTTKEAIRQIQAGAAMLALAKKPVISVNGNSTALSSREIAHLSKQIPAKIEVNLFYKTLKRLKLIEKEFEKIGVKILGATAGKKIPGLSSKRGEVSRSGIWEADVVLVMLEDGDRTEALKKMGKKVVAIDLNPLSRTAQKADVTIVDNISRCIPILAAEVKRLKKENPEKVAKILEKFKNKEFLRKTERNIRRGFK